MAVKEYSVKWYYPAGGILLLLLIWTMISRIAGSFFVPPPWTTVFDTALLMLKPGTWKQILITLSRVCAGFAIGLVAGTAVGMAAGRRARLEALFRPGVLFIQGIPPILWAIPLILILGTGYLSPLFVIGLICFPLITFNVLEGMKTVPRALEEMVVLFRPGTYPRTREVILPHLRPFFISSIRLGITLGIKASVVAEYFGSNNGIGFRIQAAYQSLQMRLLFSWGCLLVLLVMLTSRALSRVFIQPSAAGGRERERKKKPKRERRSSVNVKAGLGRCGGDEIVRFRKILLEKRHPAPLTLRKVSFGYEEGSVLLQNISLEVNPGETAVITGDSGIGKTTLLKIIGSIITPDRGGVERPGRVGFIFQDDRLLPGRSTLHNIALPLRYSGHHQRDIYCRAEELLERVGLEKSGSLTSEELSGGMAKRAALARCFADIPEIVLIDEPFSSLHKKARRFLWKTFFEMLQEHPVPAVVVTHFPEELSEFGTTFYHLTGSPAALARV